MNSLLIVTDRNQPTDAALQQAKSMVEHWPGMHRPHIQTMHLGQYLEAPAEDLKPSVTWLCLPHANARSLDEAFNRAYALHATVLLTTNQDPESHIDDGIMALPADASDEHIALCLRTLLTQTSAIEHLKAEERLLRLQQASTARHISLIDEELRLAAQLQRQFVPQTLPTLGGFGFEVMWRPAGYVSGDVYDIQRLDESHLGLFIADAVGHGVPAALMTMYIKRSLRTKVLDKSAPRGYRLVEPKDAIAELNHDLHGQNMPGQTRFATACYALINTKTRVVKFARAGHPYPLILRQDGSHDFIKADGGLLGLFEHDEFEQVEFNLGPGDRMLVYSDGFEVAFPEAGSKSIANDHYLEHFNMLREQDLAQGMQTLTDLMEQQAGSLNQRDDLTLICCALDEAAGQLPVSTAKAA